MDMDSQAAQQIEVFLAPRKWIDRREGTLIGPVVAHEAGTTERRNQRIGGGLGMIPSRQQIAEARPGADGG